MLLEVRELSKTFGGLEAVKNLNFSVVEGEIVGLIGPNGAGKTTVFNMISGMFSPTSGEVSFDGRRITGMKPHELVRLGLTRTFQLTTLFADLTVMDNVLNAFLPDAGFADHLKSIARTKGSRRQMAELQDRAQGILDLVGIGHKGQVLAGALPHGHQRLLEIAVAVATRPRILLLDEPATGMNVHETQAAMDVIQRVRTELGITVLLIEHDMKVVMGLCERIVVMEFGVKIAEGTAEAVSQDEAVIAAYLGVEDVA